MRHNVIRGVDGLEVPIMLVFWYLLLVGGVKFVMMSSCEMPYYHV
jgi:hypothetical protein